MGGIRKLDRYVALTFIGPFVLCVAGFAGLFVVADLFANIDEFFEHQAALVALRRAAVYYALRMPSLFARVMPIFCVLPAVICTIRLMRANEICAMRASGISGRRIVGPVLACVAVVTVLAAVNQEAVVPALHGRLAAAERRARKSERQRIDQALLDDSEGRLFLVGTYDPETPLPTLTGVRIAWDDAAGRHHKKRASRAFARQAGPAWYMVDVEQFDGRLTLTREERWEPRGPELFVSKATADLIARYRKKGDREDVPLLAQDQKPVPVFYEFGSYSERGEKWEVARNIVISDPPEPDVRVDMMVWAGDRWLLFGAMKLETADPTAGAPDSEPAAEWQELRGSIEPADITAADDFKGGSSARPLSALMAASERFGEQSAFRQRCRVMIWNRLAFPFANIVLVLLALPLVFRRQGHAALVGVSLAVLLVFAFLAVNFISIDLAYQRQLMWQWPPFAGTFATILFGAIGLWLFARMERV